MQKSTILSALEQLTACFNFFLKIYLKHETAESLQWVKKRQKDTKNIIKHIYK